MDDYLNSFREMISLRGLTDHTIKSYSTYIRAYLDYLNNVLQKKPEDVSWGELRDFIRWLQHQKNLSDRTINACISQLRFFTIYVLHKPWDASQLPLRKFDTFLPYVPSQNEVNIFIDSFSNLKHKAIVALMYSAGLRVGEVRQLRYDDISRSSMRIHIRSSKNRSDRFAILSRKALDILTQYWFFADKPNGFLFPNRDNPDKPMVSYTINQFIYAKETELGWEHRFSCHTFRHAFGTHLYENGTDLLTIKSLLGHKSLTSTTIYVHLASNGVASTVSPFDQMGGSSHV
jgi:site-specific recombinase XerD